MPVATADGTLSAVRNTSIRSSHRLRLASTGTAEHRLSIAQSVRRNIRAPRADAHDRVFGELVSGE
jgi:hypothetical protein